MNFSTKILVCWNPLFGECTSVNSERRPHSVGCMRWLLVFGAQDIVVTCRLGWRAISTANQFSKVGKTNDCRYFMQVRFGGSCRFGMSHIVSLSSAICWGHQSMSISCCCRLVQLSRSPFGGSRLEVTKNRYGYSACAPDCFNSIWNYSNGHRASRMPVKQLSARINVSIRQNGIFAENLNCLASTNKATLV